MPVKGRFGPVVAKSEGRKITDFPDFRQRRKSCGYGAKLARVRAAARRGAPARGSFVTFSGYAGKSYRCGAKLARVRAAARRGAPARGDFGAERGPARKSCGRVSKFGAFFFFLIFILIFYFSYFLFYFSFLFFNFLYFSLFTHFIFSLFFIFFIFSFSFYFFLFFYFFFFIFFFLFFIFSFDGLSLNKKCPAFCRSSSGDWVLAPKAPAQGQNRRFVV